ncbi:hypothetical protein [Variovorax sp. PAMC26660]|uniref:hypothetical protein n=1 Tax=Variovorax sp. PAMC26660 TaxID=2762322 RepID=UPI00164E6017|nr:hypothetical protein [Variovorax sp. PAMC26660]QNK66768.1 hypothetical protein H7F35_26865 [Variovorax sp. PAMC26660]
MSFARTPNNGASNAPAAQRGERFSTPSLPFFEAMLPQQRYLVARRPVAGTAMEATEVLRRT